MLLASLIGADVTAPAGAADIEVSGIAVRQPAGAPRRLFVAIAGSKADGARFIADAIARGAVAIVAGEGADVGDAGAVPVLRTREPRRALALMAARVLSAPARDGGRGDRHQRQDVGRRFHAADLRRARTARRASLGTIGLVKPDGGVYGSLTTPDPVSLHADAGRARRGGRDARRDRGLLARPRPAPARRRARSRRRPSPTSGATTSTITRRSRPISPPSCGCSPSCCRRMRPPSSTPTPPRPAQVVAAARQGGHRVMTVGPRGRGLEARAARARRLRAAHGGGARRPRATTCACRCSATTRRRMRWSRPGSRSRRANPRAACCRRCKA